jgi:hypothetical protein
MSNTEIKEAIKVMNDVLRNTLRPRRVSYSPGLFGCQRIDRNNITCNLIDILTAFFTAWAEKRANRRCRYHPPTLRVHI